jgi:hypothetical protein
MLIREDHELTGMFERWAVFQRAIERPEAGITPEVWTREVDPEKRLYCLDCGDGVIGHTVHDHVWRLTGLGYDGGVQCLRDLARRIGVDDFPVPINKEAREDILRVIALTGSSAAS